MTSAEIYKLEERILLAIEVGIDCGSLRVEAETISLNLREFRKLYCSEFSLPQLAAILRPWVKERRDGVFVLRTASLISSTAERKSLVLRKKVNAALAKKQRNV